MNQPSGNILKAVTHLQKALDVCTNSGAKFCTVSTKGYTCCNLENLGAFKIRLTLEFNFEKDQFTQFKE